MLVSTKANGVQGTLPSLFFGGVISVALGQDASAVAFAAPGVSVSSSYASSIGNGFGFLVSKGFFFDLANVIAAPAGSASEDIHGKATLASPWSLQML